MCRGDRDQLALGLLDIWGQPYSILCGTNQLAGRLSSWYMHGGGRTGRGGEWRVVRSARGGGAWILDLSTLSMGFELSWTWTFWTLHDHRHAPDMSLRSNSCTSTKVGVNPGQRTKMGTTMGRLTPSAPWDWIHGGRRRGLKCDSAQTHSHVEDLPQQCNICVVYSVQHRELHVHCRNYSLQIFSCASGHDSAISKEPGMTSMVQLCRMRIIYFVRSTEENLLDFNTVRRRSFTIPDQV